VPINIDVDVGARVAWGEDTPRGGVIADHWHDYFSVSKLIHDVSEVITVREGSIVCWICVLIFGLEQDDWSSICDLSFGYYAANLSDVQVRGIKEASGVGSECAIDTRQPARKTTS